MTALITWHFKQRRYKTIYYFPSSPVIPPPFILPKEWCFIIHFRIVPGAPIEAFLADVAPKPILSARWPDIKKKLPDASTLSQHTVYSMQ